MRKLLILTTVAAGLTAAAPVSASDALPQSLAQRLDTQPIEFTMTAAKQRRLMMMDSINRQQHGRGNAYGHGYGSGRGYDRGPGYAYGRSYNGYRRSYGRPAYGYDRY